MSMTKEKIASQALIRLGATPITSFTANTREASVVSTMYDTVKESLFSYANWNFATKKVALAQLSETILDKRYTKVYALPSSIVKVVGLFDANGFYDTEYSIENNKVYTTLENANLAYIEQQAEADFPAFFSEVLVAKLAFEMSEAITGIGSIHERLYQEFQQKLRQARISDGQENPPSSIIGTGSLIRAHQGQYIVRS
jgi:hypothetical protein